MALEKTRGRRIQIGELAVVVGAGRSGLAAARLLSREGARVRLLDRNTAALSPEQAASLQKLGVDVQLGEHSPEQFEHAAFVVPSPGMPVAKLAQYLGGACEGAPEVLAEMELAWRYLNDEPVLAVTGTSGKTTSTYLIKSILEQKAGAKVGLIGTIQNMIGSEVLHTERTTPESFELQKLLRRMSDAGCTHAVMEVSSHALVLDRVYGIRFAVGIFTNLSQDHLDFHRTMEEYCDAKAILFDRCDIGVYNADDSWHTRLLQNATCPRKFSYAIHADADLKAKSVQLHPGSVAFDVEADTEWAHVQVGIPAQFTVYNALDAMACCWNLGVPLVECADALARNHGVKGRMEIIPTPGKDYTILNDYSHKPDALENVLESVNGFAKGRTVVLFGCGGDRDKTKRPVMGGIAARLADFVIVTSDNPRTEEPQAIIDDILAGMRDTDTPYVAIPDRVEAIHYAMDHAQSGDVIILAGKGHEDYQEINHVHYPMDERVIVAEHLKEMQK